MIDTDADMAHRTMRNELKGIFKEIMKLTTEWQNYYQKRNTRSLNSNNKNKNILTFRFGCDSCLCQRIWLDGFRFEVCFDRFGGFSTNLRISYPLVAVSNCRLGIDGI